MKPLALTSVVITLAVAAAASAPLLSSAVGAGPLGASIPANCVPHTSFSGGADADGDYRCAGLAIEYHTGGVARSPFPIWAGQWLFVDEAGQYRVGSCTLNRGVHPTIDSPSQPVSQAFPNDPTGAKGAYLTWKYGDTTDDLTAAAMWAVFHYYAQDAAGTNRASSGSAPLVPSLDGLAADSGNAELQARALDLEDEAVRFAGQWQLTVAIAAGGVASATLLSGATPVPGQQISVLVSGADLPLAATTGADGAASVTVPLAPGTVTVAVSVPSPGSAAVFRGAPAVPDPQGAQTLVTGGEPSVLRATAQLEVIPPPTTVMPTTTVPATTVPATTVPATTTTTTAPATTTTEPAATTTAPPTTAPPTTEPTTTEPTTTEPTTTVHATIPPPTIATPHPPSLPRTGGGGGAAYLATALLVGGIGLMGTLRRRDRLAYTRQDDAG